MAAAALTPVGTGGAAAATSRFAAACGALSQYVKAAEAERKHAHARPAAVPVRPLLLMPGADVSDACSPDDGLDHLAQAAPAPAQMMTIVYGGRVLVLDDVPVDKAAGLLLLAAGGAAAAQEGAATEATAGAKRGGGQVSASAAADDLLPVARTASLQRFMEKRKVRVAARAEPYRRPDASDACPDHLKLAL
ncbi:protein TIFY 11e-like [Miscanthus floridulus]|uniref:protein TIFY 11e-like n=1 Tax=Miscanthus floridulus TaxID=154761 RepID=UPI003458E32B